MDIKWLESEKLEEWALKIIEKQQPEALVRPQEINILKLINVACKNLNYEFAVFPYLDTALDNKLIFTGRS